MKYFLKLFVFFSSLSFLVAIFGFSAITWDLRGATAPPTPPPGSSPGGGTGTLRIVKNTIGGDSDFDFIISGDKNLTIITSEGSGSAEIQLEAGEFSVREVPKKGWLLTSSSCDKSDILADQITTCTFTNATASLTIVKNTIGGDGTFGFIVNGSVITITTRNGTGSATIPNIEPSKKGYAIEEFRISDETYGIDNPPWVFITARCNDPTSFAFHKSIYRSRFQSPYDPNKFDGIKDLTILPGRSVTCTFTNAKLATLKITKNAKGNDGSFSYNTQPLDYSKQDEDDSENLHFDPLKTYPPGCVCFGEPGCGLSEFSCYYDGAYHYRTPGGAIYTQNGKGSTYINLLAGTYELGESLLLSPFFSSLTHISNNVTNREDNLPHWIFNSASCDKLHKSTEFGVKDLNLKYGETVSCNFENSWFEENGYLNIVKHIKGGIMQDKFGYKIDGPTPLNIVEKLFGDRSSIKVSLYPGEYTVTENLKDNWELESISCDSGTVEDGSVSGVVISSRETTNCTFTNSPKGILEIRKKVKGQNTTENRTFNYNIYPKESSFPLPITIATIKDNTSSVKIALEPGDYNILETSEASYNRPWTIDSASCYISYSDNENVKEGETKNKKDGTIDATVLDLLDTNKITVCEFTNTKDKICVGP